MTPDALFPVAAVTPPVADDVVLSARVTAELRAGITAIARLRGVAVSDVVREALEAKALTGAGLFELSTLEEARAHVADHRVAGVRCPACDQHAQEYRRKLTAQPAAVVVLLAAAERRRAAGDTDAAYWPTRPYIDLPRYLEARAPRLASAGGYATLGKWWDLIEQEPGRRPDGSTSTGRWRITQAGARFVAGDPVPAYVRLYNGELVGDPEGPPLNVRDALGSRFDYAELMGGAA